MAKQQGAQGATPPANATPPAKRVDMTLAQKLRDLKIAQAAEARDAGHALIDAKVAGAKARIRALAERYRREDAKHGK